MTCAEFQRVLPYLMETGGSAEADAHLKSCEVCADLVADLKYIADVAKLLVPMQDPGPAVWNRIQQSLESEGLVRPAGARGRLLGGGLTRAAPWALSIGAVVVVALGLLLFSRNNAAAPESASAPAGMVRVSLSIQDDQQVLSAVSENAPDLRASYEESLKRVNAYISDAQRSLQQNPDDEEAREFLLKAYEQKAMLYELAMTQSVQ